MKKILGHTWKAVSYNLGNLLLFEIGYRILTFFLAMQMIDHAIDFSLKRQGFSYLTAENYGELKDTQIVIPLPSLFYEYGESYTVFPIEEGETEYEK